MFSPSAATAPIVLRPFPPRSREKNADPMVRHLYGVHPRVTFVRGEVEVAGEVMRMDSPMATPGTGGSRRSGQVSLADLCFLVLAAGLAAGVVRGAREVWGTGLSRWGSNGWSPTAHFERTAGLAVESGSRTGGSQPAPFDAVAEAPARLA